MGIYLNPGNEAFTESVNSEIYIDKTDLIMYTNQVLGTEQKHICVSRPRRFGKSMAAKMLAAYYSIGCNSKTLFRELDIASDLNFYKNLNQYNVIFLNIQDFLSRVKDIKKLPSVIQETLLQELEQEYPLCTISPQTDLISKLETIFRKAGTGFVFILDEWDCLFREKKADIEAQTLYLDFLRTLLKDKIYVKLAYLTGILPIKKYGTHSALNMFDEYSMTSPGVMAKYIGFTEEEVKQLCRRYDVDFAETQRWYDGYCFDKNLHIYSPKSVIDAMRRKRFDSYWTQTETYEALKIYMEMNFDGLKDTIIQMLSGNSSRINPRTFQNDMTTFKNRDDVLTLLVHLGYLAYNADERNVRIPNLEVELEFANAIEGAGWNGVAHALSVSEELLEATIRGDANAVANAIDLVHTEAVSLLAYNNENSLSCVISLAYYSARNYYQIVREMPSGKGFADLVFLPRPNALSKPAIVIELKWDQSAKGAISQIKQKQYSEVWKDYVGEILLVGINYDKDSKKHQCYIERQYS